MATTPICCKTPTAASSSPSPYEGDYTLIGTTDDPWEGPPGTPTIDAEETRYLLDTIGRYFARPVAAADIAWTYSGIRPLYDDHAANASAVTRDYVLDVDTGDDEAPILSIFGGKITTYRKLAEHALAELAPHLPRPTAAWTAGTALPGGDMPDADFDAFLAALATRYPAMPHPLLRRLARAYGTRIELMLGSVQTPADLGTDFGGGLHRAEVDYLVAHEFARDADDILWRRSKLGLHVPPDTADRVAAYLAP